MLYEVITKSQGRIDLAALGAVIAIAELVLADELAIKRGPNPRAHSYNFV